MLCNTRVLKAKDLTLQILRSIHMKHWNKNMHILELVRESSEIMSIKVLAHFLEHRKMPGVSSQK